MHYGERNFHEPTQMQNDLEAAGEPAAARVGSSQAPQAAAASRCIMQMTKYFAVSLYSRWQTPKILITLERYLQTVCGMRRVLKALRAHGNIISTKSGRDTIHIGGAL
jgi:hypothetical protein